MVRKHHSRTYLALCSALLLNCLGFSLVPAEAQTFKPPNRGAPMTTAGGASRSSCVQGGQSLTLLVPDSTLGLTLSAHPSFFVYVPPSQAKSAEFVIKDAADNDVYRATVPLSSKAGIVSLKLPQNAPGLEVGKDYRWYFSMVCRPGDRLEDVFVSAWIQRVTPDAALAKSIQRASLRSRPALYAQSGIWHDTVSSLMELRQGNPKDLTLLADWNTLMRSVGLVDMANMPINQAQLLSGK